ncbi:MAG: GGDEF domain-containing protein [Myxococcota bacterium]
MPKQPPAPLLPDEPTDPAALVEWLRAENEALRVEVDALQVYRSLAYRDPLTGLWNRRYLDERLRHEIERARRHDARFSILVFDINDFKAINDERGHAAGDQALVWTADLLEETFRDHDVCCRTGGDEFTVILPGATAAGCAVLISRLRRRLEDANRERPWGLALSIGGSTWPEDGTSGEELLRHADAAMYEDKQRQKLGADSKAGKVRVSRPSTLPWSGRPDSGK